MLKQLATALESAGVGVIGSSVFIDSMPVGAAGIMVRGNPMGDPRDQDINRMIRASVTVIARGRDYEATRDLAQRAASALAQRFASGKVVDGFDIRRVTQRTNPVTYPPVQGAQREFAVTLDVVYFDVV